MIIKKSGISPGIAIRELIDAYTTNFEVYMDDRSATPTQIVTGRKNLFPVFDNLNTYIATMHFKETMQPVLPIAGLIT